MLRFSEYCNLSRRNGMYLLHNTLNDELLAIVDSKELHEIDVMSSRRRFHFNENSLIMKKMVEKGMLIEEMGHLEVQMANQRLYKEPEKMRVVILTDPVETSLDGAYSSEKMCRNIFRFINKYEYLYGVKAIELTISGKEALSFAERCMQKIEWLKKAMNRKQVDLKIGVMIPGKALAVSMIKRLLEKEVNEFQIQLTEQELTDPNEKENLEKIIDFLHHSSFKFQCFFRINLEERKRHLLKKWMDELFQVDDRFNILFNTECFWDRNVLPGMTGVRKKSSIPFSEKLFLAEKISCFSMGRHSLMVDLKGQILKCCSCTLNPPIQVGKLKNGGSFRLAHETIERFFLNEPDERCMHCCIYPICRGQFCRRMLQDRYCERLIDCYFCALEQI